MHIRGDLNDIPPYIPGENLPHALKLSSNELSHPPLPSVQEAMHSAVAGVNRYPDMSARALKAELADHLELDEACVTVGCGSSALCQQLVQISCLAGEEVIFPWRSFEGYPIFARVAGARPVPVALTSNFEHDLEAMLAAITEQTRLIFLCNPNNPTGTALRAPEFEEFMDQVPSTVIVALDEAYIEYLRDPRAPIALRYLQRYPNLVGLRTFSKAYGLAGLRIGYAFGNPAIMTALDKVAIPFGVNSLAQAAAIASLHAHDEILERTEEVVAQRARLADFLECGNSEANFLWYPTDQASIIAANLREQGVITRAFPEGLRITVTTSTECDALMGAWEACGLA
ncbi:histidinol-phosphate transaminase [Corynebacterium sp. ES2794-CONJ1]|uniref:histidinol-phosphate transaminase n=1 Tax=unclassified Corynebacterium TaxID=2624378 RepID=UPI002167872F|nr:MULTISPECIES: histidinol-phosphate transaminase [unclassified Corynebacterium]MCS4490370.1 histidinol-phosphate transaminase [Corynebacterium sp. ES2775-CONJ]MCS4532368.1 histidinol-phosphate transaminase [Corynebacterium sp. ES2730-CONJ]MCU9519669.1 histidinol-phosphate transaminase [Corynebacterium sp. ES2794-CONJ1]